MPVIPPVWRYIGAGVGVALLALIIVLGARSCDRRHDNEGMNLVNQGATEERAATQAETINAVSNAQEAVRNPTPEQLNVVCSRYDRNCPNGS
jgi:hypothetical protein